MHLFLNCLDGCPNCMTIVLHAFSIVDKHLAQDVQPHTYAHVAGTLCSSHVHASLQHTASMRDERIQLDIVRAVWHGVQLWRLRSPLAALDIRCWTGPDLHVPLPRITRECLQRFAAMNASCLATEYRMVNAGFAASLIERSQVLPTKASHLVCQIAMGLR